MKHECSIVRDLLPLYEDGLLSEDSKEFVAEHLGGCEVCRNEYQKLKGSGIPLPETVETDRSALESIEKKLMVQRRRIILAAVIFSVTVLTALYAIVSTPLFYPYSDDLLQVVENIDGSVTVAFDSAVTRISCENFIDDDTNAEIYFVDASSSLLERWFSDLPPRSFTVFPESGNPLVIYFSQNNGSEDVLIYAANSELVSASGGVVTLPRLALSYYSIMALGLLVLLGIALLICRKKPSVRLWLTRAILVPASYLLGHLVVKGFSMVSYALERDFVLILAVAALLFCVLLLLFSIVRHYREMKRI